MVGASVLGFSGEVKQIQRLLLSRKYSLSEIARLYHVHPMTIQAIKDGKTWKEVSVEGRPKRADKPRSSKAVARQD
jgi:hypothetical protein